MAEPEQPCRNKAELFRRVAVQHGECRSAKITQANANEARIELNLNVEMPSQFKVDGWSPNGVLVTEVVEAVIGPNFPWTEPRFLLRTDFPRNLPHLQPGPITELPEPCLVDGSLREYFYQFGLAEVGIFYLIEQLTIWLRKAALGTLIDPRQGWEPTLRRDLKHHIFFDVEGYQNTVGKSAGWRTFDAEFWILDPEGQSSLHNDAFTILQATLKKVPLHNKLKNTQFSKGSVYETYAFVVCSFRTGR